MATLKRAARGKRRGQLASTHPLADLVQATFRLWRKHHDDFVHIRVEDLLLDGDPPQLRIIHSKRGG